MDHHHQHHQQQQQHSPTGPSARYDTVGITPPPSTRYLGAQSPTNYGVTSPTAASPLPRRPLGHGLTPPQASASPYYRAYGSATPSTTPMSHQHYRDPTSLRDYYAPPSSSSPRSPTTRYDHPPPAMQEYRSAVPRSVTSAMPASQTPNRFTAAHDAHEQHLRLRATAASHHPYQHQAPPAHHAMAGLDVPRAQPYASSPQHGHPLAPPRRSSSSTARGTSVGALSPTATQAPPTTLATPRRASSSSGRSPQSTYSPHQPMPSASPGPLKTTLRPNVTLVDERDATTGAIMRRYQCGALLGKGGFARVYLFTDVSTGDEYAAKVIDKTKLTDHSKYQKLLIEIDIHARLDHPHVVKIHRHFEDDSFVYILLEKCTNQTLLELSRQRVSLTTAEVQYIMLQLLSAVGYLHSVNVIHRDLKLANVLVDDMLRLKVGDFGLAAATATTDEVKRTMCGTPNYIAPEILTSNTNKKKGYTYRADFWSLGVILYTLFVGCPPFETPDLKTTYDLIQRGSYSIPPTVPHQARSLINRVLKVNPDLRPSLVEMRSDPFFAGCRADAPPPDSLIEYYARLTGVSFHQLHARIAEHAVQRQRAAEQAAQDAHHLHRATRSRPPPLVAANQHDEQDLGFATAAPPLADRMNTISPLGVAAASPTAGSPLSPTGGRGASPQSPTIGGGDDFIPLLQNALITQQTYAMSAYTAPPHRGPASSIPPMPPLHRIALPTADAGSLSLVVDMGLFSRYGLAYRMNTGHHGAFFNDRSKLIHEALTGMAEYHDRPPKADTGAVPAVSEIEKFNILRPSDPFFTSPNKKKGTLGTFFRDYFTTRRADVAHYVALNHHINDREGCSRGDLTNCHLPMADPEYWETARAAVSGPPVLCCVPGTSAALLRDGRLALQNQHRMLQSANSTEQDISPTSVSLTNNGVRTHPTSHVVGLPLPDPLPASTTLMNMLHVRRSAFVVFDQVPAVLAALAAPRGFMEALRSNLSPALNAAERGAIEAVLQTALDAEAVGVAILKLSNGDSQLSFFSSKYCAHQNSPASNNNNADPASPSGQATLRVEPFPPIVVANATLVFHHSYSHPAVHADALASAFSILAETSTQGLGEAAFGRYSTAGVLALLSHVTSAALAGSAFAALGATTGPTAAAELVVNMSDGPMHRHHGSSTSYSTPPMEVGMAWARCLAACVWLHRAAIALEAAQTARGIASPGAVRALA